MLTTGFFTNWQHMSDDLKRYDNKRQAYCASMCFEPLEPRLLLSGTMLRKMLSEGGDLPDHFGRDEVVAILRDYYENLEEKVEIKTHKAATGN